MGLNTKAHSCIDAMQRLCYCATMLLLLVLSRLLACWLASLLLALFLIFNLPSELQKHMEIIVLCAWPSSLGSLVLCSVRWGEMFVCCLLFLVSFFLSCFCSTETIDRIIAAAVTLMQLQRAIFLLNALMHYYFHKFVKMSPYLRYISLASYVIAWSHNCHSDNAEQCNAREE